MAWTAAAEDAEALLERSVPLRALEEQLAAVRRQRRGAFVLVVGEAGIGKSALVRAFCASSGSTRVLWGACDPLDTPRPLGAWIDIAEDAGGALAAVVDEDATPGAILSALGHELRGVRPSIVVLEDLHWADEATLDVVRLLARRTESFPALVLGTCRDDELARAHPLRIALGELPSGAIERIALAPLSLDAVAALSAATGVDPRELHHTTGGNPFFVTEVLATGPSGELPATVRDAVLARAARLDPTARALVDAVAVVPERAEIWLLEAMAQDSFASLDECLASGVLRAERAAVGFRHEIARHAFEEALAPHHRIDLHRRALGALTGARAADLARVAYHAEGADDVGAVLRFAPAAAERAARFGAHREAAAQLARALRYAEHLPGAQRAELLERRSYECYLTDLMPAAVDARRRALEERRALGDRRAEGDAQRWLSRLAWFSGDNATAEEHARLAVELLEPLGPGRELAMAYSNTAQLRMLEHDEAGATSWGTLAIGLAERLSDVEILAHAMNTVGTAQFMAGTDGGRARLERSLRLALDAGLEEHVARAYTNLTSLPVDVRDYEIADKYLEEGIAYCRDHDLDSWRLYLIGYRAISELDRGRWDAAVDTAGSVLAEPGVAAPSRIAPLVVLGRVRARRGDPDAWAALDEALALAGPTGELQRLGRVAVARAEAHWLGGEPDRIAAETDAALELAVEYHQRWLTGELVLWRHRAGNRTSVPPDALAEPFRLELDGDGESAAGRWTGIGCPYEAALALAHAGAENAQRAGLKELQRLGARPAARRVAHGLRRRGVRDVREGPRAATRENPAGLTARELEVLLLVSEGLRNADIAARLFVSPRTVAHHVSAILRKLDVETRTQAGAAAARLGIER